MDIVSTLTFVIGMRALCGELCVLCFVVNLAFGFGGLWFLYLFVSVLYVAMGCR